MAYVDCMCGYRTYDLTSCNQLDCPRYNSVEVQKATETLKKEIEKATERYLARISKAR